MGKHLLAALGIGCMAIALGESAQAGVWMAVETVNKRAQGPPETAELWIDGDRVRLESTQPGAASADEAVIFHGKEQEVWALDLTTRRYTRIDRKQLEAIGRQIAAARREAEARLAGLPPEQRQLVERMLGLHETSSKVATEEIRSTDEKEEVDGRPCQNAQLIRDGGLSGEACVASWKTIGMSRLDFRVFKQLGEFQKALRESIGALPTSDLVMSQPFSVFDQLDGFPLRIRSIDKQARVRSETHFRRFEKREVDAKRFEVPEGFTEQAIPTSAAASP